MVVNSCLKREICTLNNTVNRIVRANYMPLCMYKYKSFKSKPDSAGIDKWFVLGYVSWYKLLIMQQFDTRYNTPNEQHIKL